MWLHSLVRSIVRASFLFLLFFFSPAEREFYTYRSYGRWSLRFLHMSSNSNSSPIFLVLKWTFAPAKEKLCVRELCAVRNGHKTRRVTVLASPCFLIYYIIRFVHIRGFFPSIFHIESWEWASIREAREKVAIAHIKLIQHIRTTIFPIFILFLCCTGNTYKVRIFMGHI